LAQNDLHVVIFRGPKNDQKRAECENLAFRRNAMAMVNIFRGPKNDQKRAECENLAFRRNAMAMVNMVFKYS